MPRDTLWDDQSLALPLTQHGIVLHRREGTTYTNVPHLVVPHSPSGYAWGYGGSGPADLALNILEWVLRQSGYQGDTVRCFEGTCFCLAWDLHHAFKWQFLAAADQPEVQIPLAAVATWLHAQRPSSSQ